MKSKYTLSTVFPVLVPAQDGYLYKSFLLLGIIHISILRVFLITQYPLLASEDALITIQHVENMVNHGQLVYNLGERVQGTTSPLYSLLLVVLSWFPGHTILHAGILNYILDVLFVMIIYQIFRSKHMSLLGASLVWLIGSYYPILIASSYRMETPLYMLLIGACYFFFDRNESLKMSVALGLLLMTRIDGVILTLVFLILLGFKYRQIPVKEILLVIITASPWYLYATIYYGSPLPHTMIAKNIAYINLHPWGHNLIRLLKDLSTGIYGHRIIMLPFFCYANWLSLRQSSKLSWLAPLTFFGWVYLFFFGISRTAIFQWYLVPLFVIHLVLTTVGISELSTYLFDKLAVNNNIKIMVPIMVIAISLGITTIFLRYQIKDWNLTTDNEKIGIWLSKNSSKNATVFTEPLGLIGYYSNRYMIDAVGLVSPQMLPFATRSSDLSNYDNYLQAIVTLQPDYAVLRIDEYHGFTLPVEKKVFDTNYQPVYQQGIFTVFKRIPLQ